jgi:cytochrome c
MKTKTIVWGAALGLLMACGNGGTTDSAKTEAKAESVAAADPTANPDYTKGLALVSQSDCLTCHKVNEASTGPAYAEVAKRYAAATDTTITRLAQTIIKGGSGNWGAIPMTAHPQVSQADAEQMVKYVLLLKP